MIIIYHNPRCSKSRECNVFLEASDTEVTVINYMQTLFTFETLSEVIKKLNIAPIALVRTNEKVWKELFKGTEMNDTAIIEAMVAHPKLIERPIVVNGNKAVIARPLEKVKEIL